MMTNHKDEDDSNKACNNRNDDENDKVDNN
jgi:hypothetical protein